MATAPAVLLIDAGAHPMEILAARLRRLGYRAIWTKTTHEAYEALEDPRYAIEAAVIPPDLPAVNLRGAIRTFRSIARNPELSFLATGDRPAPQQRSALRTAGVEFGLWDPLDQHTLRFQINRALAGSWVVRGHRSALRAPADWVVHVASGARQKHVRVYSISVGGAFLTTSHPFLRKTPLRVELPLGPGAERVAARVALTNVPGNLIKKSLPLGMGVVFEDTTVATAAALHLYVEGRFRALEV